MKLQDGKGTGVLAKVDSSNRLHTKAISLAQVAEESESGRAFSFNTDFVALTTTGSFSGLLYIKNEADTETPFHIQDIRVSGNMAHHQVKVYKNPTTGTLISGASPANSTNLNFKSSTTFTGDYFLGADANTITDGSVFTQWQTAIGVTPIVYQGSIILGKDDAIGIAVKPSAAGDIGVTIYGYYDKEES